MTSPVPTARGTVTARRIPAARHNDHCSGRLPTPRWHGPERLSAQESLARNSTPLCANGLRHEVALAPCARRRASRPASRGLPPRTMGSCRRRLHHHACFAWRKRACGEPMLVRLRLVQRSSLREVIWTLALAGDAGASRVSRLRLGHERAVGQPTSQIAPSRSSTENLFSEMAPAVALMTPASGLYAACGPRTILPVSTS